MKNNPTTTNLNYLKQFIDDRLGQLELHFDSQFAKQLDGLRDEIHQGFGGVGDVIDDIYDHMDGRLVTLERTPKSAYNKIH